MDNLKSFEADNIEAADLVMLATVKVEGMKTHSAWERGVKVYALELLDDLWCNANSGYITIADLASWASLKKALLNGATDWEQYSWGGSSLIYDRDIAIRLCCPSELKKNRNGERRPNGREEWLDVQARALYQASRRVFNAFDSVRK